MTRTRITTSWNRESGNSSQARRTTRTWVAALAAAVVLRLLFHAFFLPVFEGPDELQHLARAAAFADRPLAQAFFGLPMDSRVVAAASVRPCGPDLHRAFGCPPFGSEPASFNLLRDPPVSSPGAAAPNHENHQPPLYYLFAGMLLRLLRRLGLTFQTPETRLLFLRCFSVALVAAALFGPLRAISRRRSTAATTGFLLLLSFPGASEALARCSNDAMVFLWVGVALLILTRATPTAWVAVGMAVGPLIKLTAAPVAAAVLIDLWMRGRRRAAGIGALAALLVLPVQLLRGWRWGGTYELNRPGVGLDDSVGEIVIGLLRSAYTFLKTTVWLGNWSFFRAPTPVLAIVGALTLVWILSARRRMLPLPLPAHLAGAIVAGGALLLFSVANRRYYGGWGGLGGWYAWGWAPWLAVAANDLLTIDRRRIVALLMATALVSALVNAVYYGAATSLYG